MHARGRLMLSAADAEEPLSVQIVGIEQLGGDAHRIGRPSGHDRRPARQIAARLDVVALARGPLHNSIKPSDTIADRNSLLGLTAPQSPLARG